MDHKYSNLSPVSYAQRRHSLPQSSDYQHTESLPTGQWQVPQPLKATTAKQPARAIYLIHWCWYIVWFNIVSFCLHLVFLSFPSIHQSLMSCLFSPNSSLECLTHSSTSLTAGLLSLRVLGVEALALATLKPLSCPPWSLSCQRPVNRHALSASEESDVKWCRLGRWRTKTAWHGFWESASQWHCFPPWLSSACPRTNRLSSSFSGC